MKKYNHFYTLLMLGIFILFACTPGVTKKQKVIYISTIDCALMHAFTSVEDIMVVLPPTITDSSKFINGKLKTEDSVYIKKRLDLELEKINKMQLKLDSLTEIDPEGGFKAQAIKEIELFRNFVGNIATKIFEDLCSGKVQEKDPIQLLENEYDHIIDFMKKVKEKKDTWITKNKIETKDFQSIYIHCW